MDLGSAIIQRRLQKMLEQAIENGDVDQALKAIALGARTVNHKSLHGQDRIETRDPVQLAKLKNWPGADMRVLALAMSEPAQAVRVSFWDVIKTRGMVERKLDERRQRLVNAQLGQALADKDERAIVRAINAGATHADLPVTDAWVGGQQLIGDTHKYAMMIGLSPGVAELLHRRLAGGIRRQADPGAGWRRAGR